jgi:hypothetical protein
MVFEGAAEKASENESRIRSFESILVVTLLLLYHRTESRSTEAKQLE